ncbi:hypothetical protein [Streptomyces tendae]|uniref:hypothetical protein n=1 Tax=Streptomyces tendae TaxID=1932 RepID=UPI0031EE859E
MLLRLTYLAVTYAFAMLRLLPMSDHGKDAEILALRHQIGVLERQLDGRRVRFAPGDRAFLAALLRRLPTEVLRGVRPDTVMRRHRDLLARRHTARSPSETFGTATHGALDPRSHPAPGEGESQVGISAHPR